MYRACHLRSLSSALRRTEGSKPALVQEVRPRRGSYGGEDRDSLEGGQGSVITMRSRGQYGNQRPHPASDAGARHIQIEASAENGTTACQTSSGNRRLPPLLLFAALPVAPHNESRKGSDTSHDSQERSSSSSPRNENLLLGRHLWRGRGPGETCQALIYYGSPG